MSELILNILGLAAGFSVAVSTVPDLIATLKTPVFEPFGRIARNFSAAFGNGLWVAYGAATGAIPILIFCSINVILLSCLCMVQIRRRHIVFAN